MKNKREYKFTWINVAVLILAIAFLFPVIDKTWALLRADHVVGGNVTFTANNIHATISSGTVTGGTLTDASNKLKSVVFDMNSDPNNTVANSNIATWSGLNFTFNSSGDDITVTFTITNNSTANNLKIGLTATSGTLTNATMAITFDGEDSTSEIIAKKTNDDAIYVTIEITFSVTDKNANASITDFRLPFYLENTTEDATVTAVAFTYQIVDNYIYFGEWPQSLKASDVIVDESKADADGYYKGSDGSRYAKYTINMTEIGVEFYDELFPIWNNYDMNKTSDGTVLQDNNTYYFKVEKLKWRILSRDDDSALIVCDSIIQGITYQSNYIEESGSYYVSEDGENALEVEGEKIFANNYQYSELRNFLIGEFYEKAFNKLQERLIILTSVDNSADTTNNSTNPYACSDTEDYVFALSYADLINENYGFKTNASDMDVLRLLPTTDFAKATGAFTVTKAYCDLGEITEEDIKNALIESGYSSEEAESALDAFYSAGAWWLRSPISPGSWSASGVSIGYSGSNGSVYDPSGGAVPALQISL